MSQGLSRSIFDMDKLTFRVTNKNADVLISLAFWDSESAKEDLIPISGFPRKIVAESQQRTCPIFVVLIEHIADIACEGP